MAKFEIYKDAENQFRWRFHANNGRIMAESGEGYNNQENCQHSILVVKQEMANAATIHQPLDPRLSATSNFHSREP